jgi:uncharacterized protein
MTSRTQHSESFTPTNLAVEDWLVNDQVTPAADGVLAPLYEAASRGLLALPFCKDGRHVVELEQTICDLCGSTSQIWVPVSLVGVVHSSTLVHRVEPGLTNAGGPYPVVDVELNSGHRLVLTTTEPVTFAPAIGAHVKIGFRRVGGVSIPAVVLT